MKYLFQHRRNKKGKNNYKGDILKMTLNITFNLYHHTRLLGTCILRHQHIKVWILPWKPELALSTWTTVSPSPLLRSVVCKGEGEHFPLCALPKFSVLLCSRGESHHLITAGCLSCRLPVSLTSWFPMVLNSVVLRTGLNWQAGNLPAPHGHALGLLRDYGHIVPHP